MQTDTQNRNDNKSNQSVTPNLSNNQDRDTDVEALREGPIARSIEKQTAKLPSDLFLLGATASIALSLGLQMSGRKQLSNFVGHWAPTFLTLGLYNKLVKVAGHDRATE